MEDDFEPYNSDSEMTADEHLMNLRTRYSLGNIFIQDTNDRTSPLRLLLDDVQQNGVQALNDMIKEFDPKLLAEKQAEARAMQYLEERIAHYINMGEESHDNLIDHETLNQEEQDG